MVVTVLDGMTVSKLCLTRDQPHLYRGTSESRIQYWPFLRKADLGPEEKFAVICFQAGGEKFRMMD